MMKTLSPLKAGLFAILASSAILTTSVYAQTQEHCENHKGECHKKGCRMAHGEMHGHGDMHGMFAGLDLTQAQQAQIKQLLEAQKTARTESRPSKEDRIAHRNEMHSLITAATFDEAQAKALLSVQQEKRQTQALERMRVQNQIYNLLTPEQQTQFKARFEARTGKEPRG